MNISSTPRRCGRFIWHDGAHIDDESLWVRWSRFCHLNRPSAHEVRELVPGIPASRSLLNTDWRRNEAHWRQARSIQCLLQWDETAFMRGAGMDLITPRALEWLVSPTLRYCRACLAQGFHTALFQHWAVEKCPIHGERLEQTCHNCDHPIYATFYSVAQYPFECPRCQAQLTGTSFPVSEGADVAGVGRKAERSVEGWAVRDWLRAPATIGELSASSVWVPHSNAVGVVRTRRAQRSAMWGDYNWPGEVHYRLDDVSEEDNSWLINVHTYAAHREVWSLLFRLSAPWAKEIAALEQTSSTNLYWSTEGLYPSISAVAASVFQLQEIYGGSSSHARADRVARTQSIARPISAFVMNGTPLFQSPSGNAILYRHEIIGLACLLLARTGNQPNYAAYRWCAAPPCEDYCPVWRLERRDDAWLLRVRPRGSADLVQWLIARYQDVRIL